jgi:hypothetical protein
MLCQLNRVRISLQLMFMSDILTASGNRINTKILSRHPPQEAYSNMRWPHKQLTKLDIQLWLIAMLSICHSRCKTSSIGCFLGKTHRIWQWSWCKDDSTLCHLHANGKMEEVFVLGRKPNRFHYLHSQPRGNHHVVCSVQPTLDGEHWGLLLTTLCSALSSAPLTFLEVLETWGNTWLWEHMTVIGRVTWINKLITNGTLVAVRDGSYIRE